MFNEALEYFSSTNEDNQALLLLLQNNNSYSDFRRRRFIVKQNPAKALNRPLNEGIYFQINSGSLYNQNTTTQTFSIGVQNPNLLSSFSSVTINFFEIQPDNSLSLLSSESVPTNTSEYELSKTITGKDILITLEGTSSLGANVLYSSEDFLYGLIPVRQDLLVNLTLGSNNVYLPIFFLEDKIVSFLNYREATQRFFNNANYSRTFDSAAIVSLPNLEILGELTSSLLKEYVFTSLYPVSGETKTKVYGKSLLLYEFLKDFYEETAILKEIYSVDLTKYQKKNFFGSQVYRSEYYSINQSEISYKDEIDVRGLVFALYSVLPFLGKMSSSAISYYSSLVSSLVNASNSYSNKVLPEKITQSGDRSHSRISTNLMFLEILRILNNSYYSTFKNEIKTRFLNSATYIIYNDLSESVNFNQLGLDAKIAVELIRINYSPLELDNFYPLTSSLDTIATNNKVNLSNIVISNNYSSTSYNPYYNLSFPTIYDLFKNNGYLDFGENLVRFKHSFIKFRKELYIKDQGVLRSNSFKGDLDLYVLPNLYTTLTYLCYILGVDYSFYIAPIIPNQESEVSVIYQSASIYGNIVEIKVDLDKPSNILILVTDYLGGRVYNYYVSSSPSVSHSFSFILSGVNVNDVRFKVYSI